MSLQIEKFGPSGGIGGNNFTIIAEGETTAIIIRSGSWIDAIQIAYTDANGKEERTAKCGGNGGTEQILKLAKEECITKVSGRYGSYIDSIIFETNLGKKYTFGGPGGHTNFTFTVPNKMNFAGFTGRSGSFVDALGICCVSANGLSDLKNKFKF
ncbi:jacalin-like lectin [Flavobacterium sp. '19STA2R22 D10 B1']|uniref:jacalin-like lectin n=1 Tax=Flavobacterium aerium TaxID=3037261 RepID=UPI00278C1DCD|nr:jacalin-like lectin [Flavobacterium sp. '19STA2R22 D10 B1']